MSSSEQDPVPVGIGIIRRGDHFLVRQRPAGSVYAGYWEFPGGKCEPGEDPARGTARECREETGLCVVVGRRRRVVTHRYPHGCFELHFYDCATDDAAAGPAPGSGFVWVGAPLLARLRFPEANEPVIEEITRETSQGIGLGFKGIGGSRSTT